MSRQSSLILRLEQIMRRYCLFYFEIDKLTQLIYIKVLLVYRLIQRVQK